MRGAGILIVATERVPHQAGCRRLLKARRRSPIGAWRATMHLARASADRPSTSSTARQR